MGTWAGANYKPLWRGSNGFLYDDWDKYLDAEARSLVVAQNTNDEIIRRAAALIEQQKAE